MIDILTGRSVEICGVEDGPDGALKVYVGPRYNGIYVLVTDQGDQDRVRNAWALGGHVFMARPVADLLWKDPE